MGEDAGSRFVYTGEGVDGGGGGKVHLAGRALGPWKQEIVQEP